MKNPLSENQTGQGLAFALSAYFIWGVVPGFFKSIDHVPALEIYIHRVVWSVLFTGLVILFLKRHKKILEIFKDKKRLLFLCASSFFIGANWILFIWASNNNYLVEVSLGYYINPLVNIAMGMLLFREKLRLLQWVALFCAIGGVSIQTITLGQIPLISLGLALAFSMYSVTRKMAPINSLDGLFVETLILLIPSVFLFGAYADVSSLGELSYSNWTYIALLLTGPVTSIPLILFAAGVQRLKISTIGFIQYIAPSMMLFLAIFIYGEKLIWQKAVTFGFIWVALVIFTFDGVYRARKQNT